MNEWLLLTSCVAQGHVQMLHTKQVQWKKNQQEDQAMAEAGEAYSQGSL